MEIKLSASSGSTTIRGSFCRECYPDLMSPTSEPEADEVGHSQPGLPNLLYLFDGPSGPIDTARMPLCGRIPEPACRNSCCWQPMILLNRFSISSRAATVFQSSRFLQHRAPPAKQTPQSRYLAAHISIVHSFPILFRLLSRAASDIPARRNSLPPAVSPPMRHPNM